MAIYKNGQARVKVNLGPPKKTQLAVRPGLELGVSGLQVKPSPCLPTDPHRND